MTSIARHSTSSKPGLLNIAVISDIHLGHARTPTQFIVDNLNREFPDNEVTAALDIIFIAGDVFDDALMLNDEDVVIIDGWMDDLLRLAKKHDIWLIILNGTPGHDRDQSKRFVSINEISKINAKLKYIDELTIDYMPEFNMHVLYIPDELAGGPEKTLQSVKDMMRVKGMEQVDLAIMHGLFEFQLPPHVPAQKHSSVEYLKLVRELIFIGHDHSRKQLDRIHVQGSFDRLAHGYESPKGHMRALLQASGDWDVRFVENVNAMAYVTIDCGEKSLEDSLTLIKEVLPGIPDDGNVRIRAISDNHIFTNMEALVRTRPFIRWTKDPKKEKDQEIAPMTEVDTKFVPISITEDNLPELLLERMATNGASGQVMEMAQQLLGALYPCYRKTMTLAESIFAPWDNSQSQ